MLSTLLVAVKSVITVIYKRLAKNLLWHLIPRLELLSERLQDKLMVEARWAALSPEVSCTRIVPSWIRSQGYLKCRETITELLLLFRMEP